MKSTQPTKRTKGLEDVDDDTGIPTQIAAFSNLHEGSGTGNPSVTPETIGNDETSEQHNSWKSQLDDEQQKKSGLSLIRASHPGAVPVVVSDDPTVESDHVLIQSSSSKEQEKNDQKKKGGLSLIRASQPGAASVQVSDQVESDPPVSLKGQKKDDQKKKSGISLVPSVQPGAAPVFVSDHLQSSRPEAQYGKQNLPPLELQHATNVPPIEERNFDNFDQDDDNMKHGGTTPELQNLDSESIDGGAHRGNTIETTTVVAELVANDVSDAVARQVEARLETERLRIQQGMDETLLVHGVTIDESNDSGFSKSGGQIGGKNDEVTQLICGMKPFVVGVILLLVLMGGGGLAAVLSGGGKDEKSDTDVTDAPSLSPSTSPSATPNPRREYLQQVLIESVSSLVTPTEWWAMLDDPLSAENQALRWMSEEDSYYDDLGSIEPQFLAERFALAVLYYSTSGTSWTYDFHYLDNSTSVCDWNNAESVGYFYDSNGASCTDPDKVGIVTYLDLHDMRLRGTIPWEMGLLNSLTSLYMESNQLSGRIPTQLNELSSLRKIWIYGNLLTGQVPKNWPFTLEHLLLSENDLSGTLFSEWAEMMPSLDHLAMEANRFHGTIPTEFGALTKLSWLEINENDLSGTIPTEIGLLTMLTYLWMNTNNLVGTLPSEMGNINELQYIWIQENHNLTGTVPTQFVELDNLKEFFFHYTSLTGSVDSIFCMDDTAFPNLYGDCHGLNPEIECSCCSACCGANGNCF